MRRLAALRQRRPGGWSVAVPREPTVTRDGVTSLWRWRLVQTPWGGLYLHRFDGPDPDRDPHDHPWDFASVVLRGGYLEESYERPRPRLIDHRRLRPRRRRADVPHRIVALHRVPTWTLILVGARRREWGFSLAGADPDWVPWRDYPGAA